MHSSYQNPINLYVECKCSGTTLKLSNSNSSTFTNQYQTIIKSCNLYNFFFTLFHFGFVPINVFFQVLWFAKFC